MKGTILKSQLFRHQTQAILPNFWKPITRSDDPGKACATLPDAQHALEDVGKRTSVNLAQTAHGPNPYIAPYLQAGELPDGAVMPLFHEVWRIVGNDLNTANFTAKVDQVAETIFAAYSYQGKATGSKVSEAATTYVDGQPGKLPVCTVILRKQAPY